MTPRLPIRPFTAMPSEVPTGGARRRCRLSRLAVGQERESGSILLDTRHQSRCSVGCITCPAPSSVGSLPFAAAAVHRGLPGCSCVRHRTTVASCYNSLFQRLAGASIIQVDSGPAVAPSTAIQYVRWQIRTVPRRTHES